MSHKKLSFHLTVEGCRWVMKLIIYLQRSTYTKKKKECLTLGNDAVHIGAAVKFTLAFKSGYDNQ